MRKKSEPPSGDRVRANTAPDVQREIDARISRNVRLYGRQSREVLDRRIRDLDREWDIERVLEANASTLAFAGVLLGAAFNRKWLLLSAGVLGFLFWHATHGWCPPVPALRRLGVRTREEIDREKYALKFLRGDFDALVKKLRPRGAKTPKQSAKISLV